MTPDIRTCCAVDAIPGSWDAMTGNPFLKREILSILEKTHPCGQKYHQTKDAVFVTYQLNLDILTYSAARLKVPVTLLGVPMSIASAGHSGRLNAPMVAYMQRIPGLKLILNTDKVCPHDRFSSGKTLPSALFRIEWDHFDGYLKSLRSAYRYGINKALKRGRGLKKSIVDAGGFNAKLHDLYLNVYNKSEFKLERLPLAFFKEFPGTIIRFDFEGLVVGFVQLYGHKDTLYFLFGGMDYQFIKERSLYLNMLIEIIRYGIEQGYQRVELGQTAEEIKQKLGAVPKAKYMHFSHSNKIVNTIGALIRPLLAYKPKNESYRVFRKDS